jgi:photosystem II stability/assembly factor-like uncharacterized protein
MRLKRLGRAQSVLTSSFIGLLTLGAIGLLRWSAPEATGFVATQGVPRKASNQFDISSPWKFIGPLPLRREYEIAGWMTAVAVDPRNSNVVYAGAAGGGAWKTTDGGLHWVPLIDHMPSLSVGSIALDPSSPDTVYVGTGYLEHGVQDFLYWGVGILKSLDGGTTWAHLPGPFAGPLSNELGGVMIISLAIHPSNGQTLLAGIRGAGRTPSGVYRSTDGAVSWNSVLSGGAGTSVVIDPSNGNVAYAALSLASVRDTSGGRGNGVYRSPDGGATWTLLGDALPMNNLGFTTLAISPSNPLIVYAGFANPILGGGGSLLGLFKTIDGGRNWTRLSNTPSYCGDACWRRNVIRVHSTNPDIVYAGGRIGRRDGLFRTLDGGTSWNEVSTGSTSLGPFSDLSSLAFSRDGAVLYLADDGGIFRTKNADGPTPLRWENLNATLPVTSFSPGSLAIHPTDVTIAFAAPQEGSGARYSGSLEWTGVVCGDGAAIVFDPKNPNTVYATCSPDAPGVYKSTNGGKTRGDWVSSQIGLDLSERYAVYRQLAIDQFDPQRLYYGSFRVYRSVDGAGSWQPISGDLAGNQSALSVIAVAPSDSDTVYVGSTGRFSGFNPPGLAAPMRLSVTTNATSGQAVQWVNQSAGLPTRWVSDIVVDSADARIAFVTFQGFSGFPGDIPGHVFKTSNGGVSWFDVSGNLPNVPANAIVIDPDLADTLYVATDDGVFGTQSGGGSWAPLADGMPHVMVMTMRFHRTSRTLRAGTLGRGMWDLQIPR